MASAGDFHWRRRAELPMGKHSSMSMGPGSPSGVENLITLLGGPS